MTESSKWFLAGTLLGIIFGIWFIYFVVRFFVERDEEESDQ